MSDAVSLLAHRATSSYPISIGTALALETLFSGDQPVYDEKRTIPPRVDLTGYQEFWINLQTLYRNLLGSLNVADQLAVMPGDLLSVLEFEVDLIKELVSKATQGQVKVVYYYSNYVFASPPASTKYLHAILRVDTTPKQKLATAIRHSVLQEYLFRHQDEQGVRVFDDHLHPNQVRALILTHDAYDLLSHSASVFSKLDLLESHTGRLKGPSLWNSKYTYGKETQRIPFNACFMQVFGDSHHFLAFPKSARQSVLTMAEERRWTPMTTMDRLRLSIDQMPGRELGNTLKKMLSE